ncbi:flagellar biosynthetic protein FliR [Acidithiobacillus thiooxidans]|uniref:Flagellar biosynthetic protein FliR n=1 Tax=Acidithiobacillus thiooxidans ATCC 19377 TaxID=637390 RepID=A0A5P9XPL5_ACITH|nr:flagellar biosynthetic protein FliR [Acidithiobacillus thiooxidans]QFX95629.1 flagellar biosynthetic protein FliR [Acidithiobacillus thiooxidans ATCC 19377]
MIHFTSLQLEHWIGLVFWPFVRVLALLSTAPVFSATQVPVQVRVGLALLISVAIAPALPAMPAVHFLSGEGVVLLIQQLLIGFGLGFAITLIFSVIQFSGSVISLQMGLGFSSFFDPTTGVQVPTLSNFLNLLVLLLFMGMNGQLLVLATLMRSFTLLPVSASLSLNPSTWHLLVSEGAVIFSLGLAISTPVLGTSSLDIQPGSAGFLFSIFATKVLDTEIVPCGRPFGKKGRPMRSVLGFSESLPCPFSVSLPSAFQSGFPTFSPPCRRARGAASSNCCAGA